MDGKDIEVLSLLGSTVRMEMVTFLLDRGEAGTEELFEHVGYTDAKCWFHLRKLRAGGIVVSTKPIGMSLTLAVDTDRLRKALETTVRELLGDGRKHTP